MLDYWQSFNTLENCGKAALAMLYVAGGIFFWECVSNPRLEWGLLTRKIHWRWSMCWVLLIRLLMWPVLIAGIVLAVATTPINCKAWSTTVLIFGAFVICLASTLFMLRTVAIWNADRRLVIFLCLVVAGQLAVWLHAINAVHITYVPFLGKCVLFNFGEYMHVGFIYNEAVDSVVILLAAYKLVMEARKANDPLLYTVFIREGLVYYIIAFVANTLQLAFMLWNANQYMQIILIPFAEVTFAVCACRAYMALIPCTTDVLPPYHSNHFFDGFKSTHHQQQQNHQPDLSPFNPSSSASSLGPAIIDNQAAHTSALDNENRMN